MIINEGEVLGLVPARGGSKTIPLKNMHRLNGEPLIFYVISAAHGATDIIDRLVCSTDHDAIARYCESLGVEVIRRPPELSTDDSPTHETVKHVLEELGTQDGEIPGLVVLLQPTSPFLLPQHVRDLVKLLRDNKDLDSAQTISPVPHNYHALNQRIFENGRVTFRYDAERRIANNKQKKPKLYKFGNLVAFRSRSILEGNDCFGQNSAGLVIPPAYSVDVDGPEDFEYAEYLISKDMVLLPPRLSNCGRH